MTDIDTDVAIVGAGPAGLMLAIELGCRGIACVIIDKEADPPQYPKANATSARTMEHYRRRGFAGRVRAAGLPADHPQDVVYLTRLTGLELARFRGPSARQARKRSDTGDFDEAGWPSPELPHRGQQMYIEAILRDELGRYPSVRSFFGEEVSGIEETSEAVVVKTRRHRVRARYGVGCDGARSIVRAAMDARYAGKGAEQRAFFGGQMATIYLESAELASLLPKDKAWQYWFVNADRRGVLIAIDGRTRFAFAVQLQAGQELPDLDVPGVLRALVGQDFDYRLLHLNTWTAGHMLVAERFRRGRCFIAGDAAHLFTPTSGMGYNTSVDDAVNLGWKLAAVLRGWAGSELLDTYERERQPVAWRNTAYARAMAESMAALAPSAGIEDAGVREDRERTAFGARCRSHIAREYNIPGLQLGVRYESAAVAVERGAPPPDEATVYRPSGYPGVRAPHLGTQEACLYDRFGMDFTLLCLGGVPAPGGWREAAQELGIPLTELLWDDPQACALYGATLVLIRPDGHIAWRGNTGDGADEASVVLRRAVAR